MPTNQPSQWEESGHPANANKPLMKYTI